MARKSKAQIIYETLEPTLTDLAEKLAAGKFDGITMIKYRAYLIEDIKRGLEKVR